MMPLQKQLLEVDFSRGLSQGTDTRLLPNGALETLTNARWNKAGAISKRAGNDALPNTSLNLLGDSQGLAQAMRLVTNDRELVAVNSYDRSVYGYAEQPDKWVPRGLAPGAVVTRDTMTRDFAVQSSYDTATVGGYLAVSWVVVGTSGSLARIRLVDVATGEPVIADLVLLASTNNIAPKFVVHGTVIRMVRHDATEGLVTRTLDTAAPHSGWSAESTIVARAHMHATNEAFDVTSWDTGFTVCYFGPADMSGVVDIIIRKFNASATQTHIAQIADVAADHTIAIAGRAADATVYVAWDEAHDIKAWHGSTTDLAQTVAEYTVSTHADYDDTANIAILPHGATGGGLTIPAGAWFVWDRIDATDTTAVAYKEYSTAGVNNFAEKQLHCCALVSKPWLGWTSEPHVVVKFDIDAATLTTTLQESYFLLRLYARTSNFSSPWSRPQVLGVIAPRQGEHRHVSNSLVSPAIVETAASSGTRAMLALGVGSQAFGSQYPQGLDLVTVDTRMEGFGAIPARVRNQIVLAGSYPSVYDGRDVSEIGFAYFPEIISATGSATAGSLSSGTYQVTCVYEWTDADGYTHQSAPSPPETVVLVGVGSNMSIDIEVTNLHLTNRPLWTTTDRRVRIIPYRTIAGGSIFYRCFHKSEQLPDTCLNSVTSAFTTINVGDGTHNDATIISFPVVYTTGGAVDNVCPPSASFAFENKGTLFLCGGEDPQTIWCSKALVAEEAPAFNEAFTFRIEGAGPIVAGAPLGEATLFFSETEVWAVYGDGPSDTLQGNFSAPRLVSRIAGCTDPRSVVVGPNGVYFQGSRGLYLCDSAQQVSLISGPVESTLAAYPIVTSAAHVEHDNHVRWSIAKTTYASGFVLCFDYLTGQWSTYKVGSTGLIWSQCEHAGLWHTWSEADLCVYRESLSSWRDGANLYTMVVKTGPIKLAGLQGFARAWRASLLGEIHSRSSVSIDVFHDYAATKTSTVAWTDTQIAAVVGTPRLQLQWQIVKQKCESIAVSITVTDVAGVYTGECLTLSGLSFVYGVRPGLARRTPGERGQAPTP